MRTLSIASLIILFATAREPAHAQVMLAANPYSAQFAQIVRQNQEAWKQLDAQISDVVTPKLVSVEVTMSCGLYTELEASYSNGMVESKEIPGDAGTQSRLGNLFDRSRTLVNVVTQPCMQ